MATAVANPVSALHEKDKNYTSYINKIDQYYDEIAKRSLPEPTGDPATIE